MPLTQSSSANYEVIKPTNGIEVVERRDLMLTMIDAARLRYEIALNHGFGSDSYYESGALTGEQSSLNILEVNAYRGRVDIWVRNNGAIVLAQDEEAAVECQHPDWLSAKSYLDGPELRNAKMWDELLTQTTHGNTFAKKLVDNANARVTFRPDQHPTAFSSTGAGELKEAQELTYGILWLALEDLRVGIRRAQGMKAGSETLDALGAKFTEIDEELRKIEQPRQVRFEANVLTDGSIVIADQIIRHPNITDDQRCSEEFNFNASVMRRIMKLAIEGNTFVQKVIRASDGKAHTPSAPEPEPEFARKEITAEVLDNGIAAKAIALLGKRLDRSDINPEEVQYIALLKKESLKIEVYDTPERLCCLLNVMLAQKKMTHFVQHPKNPSEKTIETFLDDAQVEYLTKLREQLLPDFAE